MTKVELVALWMDGDDAEVARKVGISRRQVRYWRLTPNYAGQYDDAIWQAARELQIDRRGYEWQLVPIRVLEVDTMI